MMTAKELIARLNQAPPDAEVVVNSGQNEVMDVRLDVPLLPVGQQNQGHEQEETRVFIVTEDAPA